MLHYYLAVPKCLKLIYSVTNDSYEPILLVNQIHKARPVKNDARMILYSESKTNQSEGLQKELIWFINEPKVTFVMSDWK